MAETQHAAGLSKLIPATTASSESSAAPFAARLRIARWCNPGWTLFGNRVRLPAGRLNCLSVGNQIQSSRKRRGTQTQNAPARSFTPGCSQPCRKKARHFSGRARLIWASLQHAASLPVLYRCTLSTSLTPAGDSFAQFRNRKQRKSKYRGLLLQSTPVVW